MRKAYTVLEFCIVMAVLLLVSVVAVPGFGRASVESKAKITNSITSDINYQIALYIQDHNGQRPGRGSLSFVESLLAETDKFGSAYTEKSYKLELEKCGPYLDEFPANPLNGKKTVRYDGPEAGADTHGWRYDSSNNIIESDIQRTDKRDIIK